MMRYLAVAVLISLLSVAQAPAVELFRYALTMPDGRELLFAVILPNGVVVVPRVGERL